MHPREPTLAVLSNPLLRYFLATRPAFLSVTLFACLIGLGTAYYDGVASSVIKAFATLFFALALYGLALLAAPRLSRRDRGCLLRGA